MTPTVVVFDIGGVLLDWQPHLAWVEDLGSEDAARAFMERVGFLDLNRRGDRGEPFAGLAREIADPADAALVAGYVARFGRTVQTPVAESWALLARLRDRGVAVHAITNWSAETWPEGLRVHPGLAEMFGTVVVSGLEGVIKPDRRIFDLLCERADVPASACLFIDDSALNVEGARAAGMDGHHFTSPAALETALTERGLL